MNMRYWIYEEDGFLRLDIIGTGKRGMCKMVPLDNTYEDLEVTKRRWVREMTDMGYKDGNNPDVERWVAVIRVDDKGHVSGSVMDALATDIPTSGTFARYDLYADRYDTQAAAEEALKEALEG